MSEQTMPSTGLKSTRVSVLSVLAAKGNAKFSTKRTFIDLDSSTTEQVDPSVISTLRPHPVSEILVYVDRNQYLAHSSVGAQGVQMSEIVQQMTKSDVKNVSKVISDPKFANDVLVSLFPVRQKVRPDAPQINAYNARDIIIRAAKDAVARTKAEPLSGVAESYLVCLFTKAFARFGIYTKVPHLVTFEKTPSRYSVIDRDAIDAAILRSYVSQATATFLKDCEAINIETNSYLYISIYSANLSVALTTLSATLNLAIARVDQLDDVLGAVKAYVTGGVYKYDEKYHEFINSSPIVSLSRIDQIVNLALASAIDQKFSVHHTQAAIVANDVYNALSTDVIITKVPLREWLNPFGLEREEGRVIVDELFPSTSPSSKVYYTVDDTIFEGATRFVAAARENEYVIAMGLNGSAARELHDASKKIRTSFANAVVDIADVYATSTKFKKVYVDDALRSTTLSELCRVLAISSGLARIGQSDSGWVECLFIKRDDLVDWVRSPGLLKFGLLTRDFTPVLLFKQVTLSQRRPITINPIVDEKLLETNLINSNVSSTTGMVTLGSDHSLDLTIENGSRVNINLIPNFYSSTNITLRILREEYVKVMTGEFVEWLEEVANFQPTHVEGSEDDAKAALESYHFGLMTHVGSVLGSLVMGSPYARDRTREFLLARSKELGWDAAQTETTFSDRRKIMEYSLQFFSALLGVLGGEELTKRFDSVVKQLNENQAFATALVYAAGTID